MIKTIIVLTSLILGCFAFSAEKITVPDKLKKHLKSFEPSGVVYLSDLDQYLVASDDTDKKDSPLLFLMDENGSVNKKPLLIKGLEKMTDIESLSHDEHGDLIILSSLSLNKNGKNLIERNLLVKAHRQGTEIEMVSQVELRPLLLKALKNSEVSDLKSLYEQLKQELNVEASFIKDGEFYIGLKSPQSALGTALILNLGPLDDLFSQEIQSVQLWKSINFAAISGEQDLLSETAFVGDNIILLTTNPNGTGCMWKFELQSNKLFLIQKFDNLNPEGLAIGPNFGEVLITFDQDEEAAMFTWIKNLILY